MKSAKRYQAWRFGLKAELVVAGLLRCKGYRILVRRYKTPVGEIDLIARRGRLLCFIEVKARRQLSDGLPVSNRQMNRIARASQLYVQAAAGAREMDIRYDVVMVHPWRWPVHVPDAWRPQY